MQPLLPCIAVALGASATLLAMEFAEQLGSVGRIEGVADALGGSAWIGLAIVGVCATIVTIVGLRSARVLLSRAVAVARTVFAWILLEPRPRVRAAIVLRVARDTNTCSPAFIARCFGMRAPPLPALV
jgi:purine-cytosine permease-like protein